MEIFEFHTQGAQSVPGNSLLGNIKHGNGLNDEGSTIETVGASVLGTAGEVLLATGSAERG